MKITKIIHLIHRTHRQVALIDLEDAPLVERYKWYACYSGMKHRNKLQVYARGYINKNGNISMIAMSRLIMGLARGDRRQVDHINHNTLDNRKENLRIVTTSQNGHNKQNVKGYYWSKLLKQWRAQICIDNKKKALGCFKTKELARNAYIKAKMKGGLYL